MKLNVKIFIWRAWWDISTTRQRGEKDTTDYYRVALCRELPSSVPIDSRSPAPHSEDKFQPCGLSEERREVVGSKHRLAHTVKLKATVWQGTQSDSCRRTALSLWGEHLPHETATESEIVCRGWLVCVDTETMTSSLVFTPEKKKKRYQHKL